MEIIKCKKCGCEMSSMSEACPLCGTITHEVEDTVLMEPTKKSDSKNKVQTKAKETIEKNNEEVLAQNSSGEYKVLTDVVIAESLLNLLKSHVNSERKRPQFSYQLMAVADEGEIVGHIVGEDYLIGTNDTFTNRPNLNFFITLKTEEEKDRFKKLQNSSLYKSEYKDAFSIECGEDAQKCAYLFSEIIQKVWGLTDEIEFEDFGDKLTYEKICLYLNEDKGAWNKITNLIKVYNLEAQSNKYPLFELVESERIIKGSLPSYLDKGGALSKTHKTFKKMKKEFETIIEMALNNLAV